MSGDDIVKRLRTEGRVYTHMEAAAVIERLDADLSSLRAAVQTHHDTKHGTTNPAAVLSPPDIALYSAAGIEHRTMDADTLDAIRRAGEIK